MFTDRKKCGKVVIKINLGSCRGEMERMDTQIFWNVIGEYNAQTIIVQIGLFIFLIVAIVVSYIQKINWSAKFALGITNLFIGIGFFALYGIVPVQKYFSMPLYLFCGVLFLYESWHSRNDVLQKPNILQAVLLALYLLYPFVSVLLGNSFPQMTTYIMPCPAVSLSIIVYAGYKNKNKFLLALLTVWGLTGIKSVFFNVYEDLILLICGLYGVVLLFNEIKLLKQNKS